MAEMSDEERRHAKRRENDKWVTAMIQDIVTTNNIALAEQRRRGQRALRSLAVGYLILMLGLAFGLWQLERRDAHRFDKAITTASAAQRDSTVAQFAECRRVNSLRQQANEGNEIIFATLWVSAQRERVLARVVPADRSVHLRSARALELLAGLSRHTSLTNCELAIYFAASYKPPRAQPFDPKTNMLVRRLERLGS